MIAGALLCSETVLPEPLGAVPSFGSRLIRVALVIRGALGDGSEAGADASLPEGSRASQISQRFLAFLLQKVHWRQTQVPARRKVGGTGAIAGQIFSSRIRNPVPALLYVQTHLHFAGPVSLQVA